MSEGHTREPPQTGFHLTLYCHVMFVERSVTGGSLAKNDRRTDGFAVIGSRYCVGGGGDVARARSTNEREQGGISGSGNAARCHTVNTWQAGEALIPGARTYHCWSGNRLCTTCVSHGSFCVAFEPFVINHDMFFV